MLIPARLVEGLGRLLAARGADFVELLRIAELDPRRDLRRANLSGVDFGTADLNDWDLEGANLEGADLSRVRNLANAKLRGVRWAGARMPVPPSAFDMEEVLRLILGGKAPPTEWAPFIRELDFRPGQRLSNLAPLAGLSALQSLSLAGTQVEHVVPLAGLTALRRLYLGDTRIRDVSPLAGLSALQILNLAHSQVRDVAPLAELSALEVLNLARTKIVDVAPLAELTALEILDISNTRVSDLAALAGLTALRVIYLSFTEIRDVTPLAGLAGLLVDLGPQSSTWQPNAKLFTVLEAQAELDRRHKPR